MKIKNQFKKCFVLAFGVGAMMFVACGDDSTSAKDKETSTPIAGEVETKGDLPNCNSKREGTATMWKTRMQTTSAKITSGKT